MHHVGIDLHKIKTQICVIDDRGEVLREQRVRTDAACLFETLREFAGARVLLESCGESEWVARALEAEGFEVIVADPSYAPMYAHSHRRVKTDRRDARVLADACRLGAYRRAHRASDAHRHLRATLLVRETLVRTRAKYVTIAQALVRRRGLRVRTGSIASFARRIGELQVPEELACELAPLLAQLEPLAQQIAACDTRLKKASCDDERARLLTTVPCVGPLTATAVVAVLDTPDRFAGPHHAQSYVGLVPSERSSGEIRRRGSITKAGDRLLRSLLVQAALRIRRVRPPAMARMLAWSDRIAERRGKRVATIALARRLLGVLFAMMRDGTVFEPDVPVPLPTASAA